MVMSGLRLDMKRKRSAMLKQQRRSKKSETPPSRAEDLKGIEGDATTSPSGKGLEGDALRLPALFDRLLKVLDSKRENDDDYRRMIRIKIKKADSLHLVDNSPDNVHCALELYEEAVQSICFFIGRPMLPPDGRYLQDFRDLQLLFAKKGRLLLNQHAIRGGVSHGLRKTTFSAHVVATKEEKGWLPGSGLLRSTLLFQVKYKSLPPGLKWEISGTDKPTRGRELSNSKLLKALEEGKTEFTKQAWEAFEIKNLRPDDFIKARNSYFKPAALWLLPEAEWVPASRLRMRDKDGIRWQPLSKRDQDKIRTQVSTLSPDPEVRVVIDDLEQAKDCFRLSLGLYSSLNTRAMYEFVLSIGALKSKKKRDSNALWYNCLFFDAWCLAMDRRDNTDHVAEAKYLACLGDGEEWQKWRHTFASPPDEDWLWRELNSKLFRGERHQEAKRGGSEIFLPDEFLLASAELLEKIGYLTNPLISLGRGKLQDADPHWAIALLEEALARRLLACDITVSTTKAGSLSTLLETLSHFVTWADSPCGSKRMEKLKEEMQLQKYPPQAERNWAEFTSAKSDPSPSEHASPSKPAKSPQPVMPCYRLGAESKPERLGGYLGHYDRRAPPPPMQDIFSYRHLSVRVFCMLSSIRICPDNMAIERVIEGLEAPLLDAGESEWEFRGGERQTVDRELLAHRKVWGCKALRTLGVLYGLSEWHEKSINALVKAMESLPDDARVVGQACETLLWVIELLEAEGELVNLWDTKAAPTKRLSETIAKAVIKALVNPLLFAFKSAEPRLSPLEEEQEESIAAGALPPYLRRMDLDGKYAGVKVLSLLMGHEDETSKLPSLNVEKQPVRKACCQSVRSASGLKKTLRALSKHPQGGWAQKDVLRSFWAQVMRDGDG